jgi:hypothetical protein
MKYISSSSFDKNNIVKLEELYSYDSFLAQTIMYRYGYDEIDKLVIKLPYITGKIYIDDKYINIYPNDSYKTLLNNSLEHLYFDNGTNNDRVMNTFKCNISKNTCIYNYNVSSNYPEVEELHIMDNIKRENVIKRINGSIKDIRVIVEPIIWSTNNDKTGIKFNLHDIEIKYKNSHINSLIRSYEETVIDYPDYIDI